MFNSQKKEKMLDDLNRMLAEKFPGDYLKQEIIWNYAASKVFRQVEPKDLSMEMIKLFWKNIAEAIDEFKDSTFGSGSKKRIALN